MVYDILSWFLFLCLQEIRAPGLRSPAPSLDSTIAHVVTVTPVEQFVLLLALLIIIQIRQLLGFYLLVPLPLGPSLH